MTDVDLRNRILAKLPREELEVISPDLHLVTFIAKNVLYEPFATIEDVYFVTSGVISMVNEPDTGEIVEVATIGPEGMAGFPVLLGSTSLPSRTLVQIPGDGLRMKAADLTRNLQRAPILHRSLLRATMALINQVGQNVSCNRIHEVQERCARWLLQTRDRVETDTFPLTQEFLAQMLGVHRPTVSIAAAMLQKAGLIEYTRGQITIQNRKGLEAASCSCYRLIKDEYDRLLEQD